MAATASLGGWGVDRWMDSDGIGDRGNVVQVISWRIRISWKMKFVCLGEDITRYESDRNGIKSNGWLDRHKRGQTNGQKDRQLNRTFDSRIHCTRLGDEREKRRFLDKASIFLLFRRGQSKRDCRLRYLLSVRSSVSISSISVGLAFYKRVCSFIRQYVQPFFFTL